MSKARDLADFISTGSILSDGTLETVEINGVTASAEEVNKLDGVTVTTDEINYLAGASSAIQTQINNKAPISSPTFTGTATTPTLDATASVQLNGTEIVDSTRQLKNIASVDATTVAALGAAGVGGGSTRDFTATGAITAGDIVSLLSDGTVSTTTLATAGSEQVVTGSGTNLGYGSISVKNNVVAITYQDINNSYYPSVVIGTISGSTVTFGTPVVMASEQAFYLGINLVSDASWGLIHFSGSGRILVKRFTISGTTPTGAQSVEPLGSSGYSQGKFISDSTFMWSKAPDTLKAITWNGTILSVGSSVDPTDRSVNDYFNIVRYSDTEGIIAISDTSEDVRLAGFSVSGTTTTIVTKDFLLSNRATSSGTDTLGLAPRATSGQFIAIQPDNNVSVDGHWIHTFSYNGSTFTAGSSTVLPNVTIGSYGRYCLGVQHLGSDTFAMMTTESGSTWVHIFSIVGDTPYFIQTVEASNYQYVESFLYSAADQIQLNSDGTLYVGATSSSNKASTVAIDYSEANPFAWIGMAEATVADGETVTCTTIGGTNSSRTGLTIGSGIFSGSYKVGTALSATEVLITGADK